MSKPYHTYLQFGIAAVWLINGLYCKVLGFVPRHQEIVARILGADHAFWITKAIGAGEILIFAWIISRIQARLCAATQIALVLTMNLIEFVLARDLLLLGPFNSLFAVCFAGVVYAASRQS